MSFICGNCEREKQTAPMADADDVLVCIECDALWSSGNGRLRGDPYARARRRKILAGLERPTVRLVGEDGNVFAIMARCQRAARKAGWTQAQIDALLDEMKSGDYDHALYTAMNYFNEETLEKED